MPVDLPPLTAELLAATKVQLTSPNLWSILKLCDFTVQKYLDVAEDDPLLKSSLELLAEFSRQRNSATVLMSAEVYLVLTDLYVVSRANWPCCIQANQLYIVLQLR